MITAGLINAAELPSPILSQRAPRYGERAREGREDEQATTVAMGEGDKQGERRSGEDGKGWGVFRARRP